jgi:hypothetical protein
MDVEDLHPLRSTKLYDVVPPLGFLRRCRSKKAGDPDRFQEALREAILSHPAMDMEIPENEKKFKNPDDPNESSGDPYLIAGYGVNAFFSLTRSLMIMFMVISVFMSPVMYMYKNGSQQGITNYSPKAKLMFNRFTLGNLGGSRVFCEQYKIDTQDFMMKCPNGNNAIIVKQHKSKQTGKTTNGFEFGVIPNRFDSKKFCLNEALKTDYFYDEAKTCDDILDIENMNK